MHKSRKSRTFALVIELERHIEILLLSNDCVIVPDLGGFMAHHVDASYNDEEQQFLPPLRTLGFNPQLTMNDSLLVQSYIEAYDMSYPEALRRIESEVSELKQCLETDGSYELNDIGVISLNSEGHYEFEPCEAGILTPALYGLSSFYMPVLEKKRKPYEAIIMPLSEEKETIAKVDTEIEDETAVDEEQEEKERTISIKLSWLRNTAAVAAAIILFFFITTPISNSNVTGEIQQSAVFHIANKSTKPATIEPIDNIQAEKEEAMTIATKEKTDSITIVPEKTVAPQVDEELKENYVIVLASETSKRNATAFVERLHELGFGEARMTITNKMTRVVYGSYTTNEEAQQNLRELRGKNSSFKEGWVYKLKN